MLFYIPNLFAYCRIVLCTIMIYLLPKKPVASFILTCTSGLLDMIDGRFARHFHQTSKLGLLFDVSIDRLTNLAQFFHLARIYPKYCNMFLMFGFFEIIRDVVFWTGTSYDSMMNMFEYIYMNKSIIVFDNLKNDVYSNVLLNKKPRLYDRLNSSGVIVQDYLIPLIWYASDLFYWIIYVDGFYSIKKNSKQTSVKNDDGDVLLYSSDSRSSIDSGDEMHTPKVDQIQSNDFNQIKLSYFVDIFVNITKRVDSNVNLKSRCKFIDANIFSYMVGCALMFCALMKTVHTLSEIFLVTIYIIKIDYKAIDYALKIKQSN